MLGKALGINFPNIIDHFMLKNSIIIAVEEYQKNKEEVARNQGTNTIVWNLSSLPINRRSFSKSWMFYPPYSVIGSAPELTFRDEGASELPCAGKGN